MTGGLLGGTENEMHWLRLDRMSLQKLFHRVKGQWHLLKIPQQEIKTMPVAWGVPGGNWELRLPTAQWPQPQEPGFGAGTLTGHWCGDAVSGEVTADAWSLS